MKDGAPTNNFLRWCKKTEGLTDEQWVRGFSVIEKELEENARGGRVKEMWPPSYAEFIGFCNQVDSGDGSNKLYKDFYERDDSGAAIRLPEPEYQRQKRKEKGLQHTSRILNMFNEG